MRNLRHAFKGNNMTERTPISRSFLINDKNIHVLEWRPNERDGRDDRDEKGESERTAREAGNTKNSPIVLLHATGFHARCWDQVIHKLPNVPIFAIDILCHGKSDSIDPPYDWQFFATYIEALVLQLELTNIMAVGHSFGGHLLTRIAASKPEFFKHVLLLDPVIGDPEHIKLWQTAAQANNPVAKRRNQWASSEELQEKLAPKIPFNTWSTEVLTDYCKYGLIPSSSHEGYELACPPKCEAAIYGTSGAEDIYDMLPNIHVPITIIRAQERKESDAMFDFRPSPTWKELVNKLPNAKEIYCADRTHFFPMEDPQFVADTIRSLY